MKTWTITGARAHIAELFQSALAEGPQRVERRDREAVVVIGEADWLRFAREYPDMAELVLNCPLEPEDLPLRRPARALGGSGE